jgi:hypothetical protein
LEFADRGLAEGFARGIAGPTMLPSMPLAASIAVTLTTFPWTTNSIRISDFDLFMAKP